MAHDDDVRLRENNNKGNDFTRDVRAHVYISLVSNPHTIKSHFQTSCVEGHFPDESRGNAQTWLSIILMTCMLSYDCTI